MIELLYNVGSEYTDFFVFKFGFFLKKEKRTLNANLLVMRNLNLSTATFFYYLSLKTLNREPSIEMQIPKIPINA